VAPTVVPVAVAETVNRVVVRRRRCVRGNLLSVVPNPVQYVQDSTWLKKS